jgi:2',3'-cyclic-nucleotide 2'-phosphodiesterase (5'-nucleotidase family)
MRISAGRKIVFAAAVFAAAVLSGCARTHTIAIYSTANVQGHFYSRKDASFPGGEGGGFAVLSNLLRSDPLPRMLFMGGNWFYGTPEGTLTNGTSAIDLMNALGYNAAAPGPDDFVLGSKTLTDTIARAKFPVVCSNMYDLKKSSHPDFCVPYIVTEVGGIKIGVIGLVSQSMFKYMPHDKMPPLRIKSAVDEAKKAVDVLSHQNVKFIIALSQLAEADDERTLAVSVPSISLILSGRPGTDQSRPVQVGGTYIIQSTPRLASVARLELDISAYSGRILRMRSSLLPLDKAKYGEDAAVLRKLGQISSSIDSLLSRVAGRATAPIPDTGWPDSPLGNWVADCLRRWGHADIGMVPAGVFEGDIPEGPVTDRNLYSIYPADDSIMFAKLRGSDIRQVIEDSLSEHGQRIYIGGAQVIYNRNAKSVSVREVLIDGDKMADNKIYHLSVPDRMVGGAGGSSSLVHAMEFANTRELVRTKIGWCMGRERSIHPPDTGRWVQQE